MTLVTFQTRIRFARRAETGARSETKRNQLTSLFCTWGIFKCASAFQDKKVIRCKLMSSSGDFRWYLHVKEVSGCRKVTEDMLGQRVTVRVLS